jgi:hypothetical protein
MGTLAGERACGGATPFSAHRPLLLAVALEQKRRGKSRERMEEEESTGMSSGGYASSLAPMAIAAATGVRAELKKRQ